MVENGNMELGEQLSEGELCPDYLLAGQQAAFARDIERLQARIKEFVSVVCPACEAEDPLFAFQKYRFEYVRCKNCGTIYMSPRPSERVMADYYANSENYAFWAKHIFPASEASRREKIHKPWLRRVLNYCERFEISRGTLLEVGPGFGTFSSVAKESGAFERVIAVEPTPELAAACRERGVIVIAKRVEDLGVEVRNVDVVVAFEVIEHLFDPRRFVEAIHTVLAQNSLLVLSCPNGDGFDISLLGPDSLAVDPEHVNLFNPDSLSHLLDSTGFDVLQAHTPGRLDAEFVREAALQGKIELDPFLRRVLIAEWEALGWPFQEFLAQHGLSSHMWIAARRR